MFFIYGGLILALSAAQYYGRQDLENWLKPAASFGFILIALLGGALYWPIGLWLLCGLIFCAVGDICLLPKDRLGPFRAGIAAFALGHICYICAMLSLPHSPISGLIALPFMAAICLITYSRLKPSLPRDMKAPILIYMAIISVMVAAAFATQNLTYIGAAITFAVSDIYVGRDRFETHKPSYALIITWLYYSAQGSFASLAAINHIG